MQTNREKLLAAIQTGEVDEMTAMLFNQLLKLKQDQSTRALMDVCLPKEMISKIDTAYPADYAKRIREVLPNWNGSYNVFSYNNNRVFGEMLNVAEYFTGYIINILTMRDQLEEYRKENPKK